MPFFGGSRQRRAKQQELESRLGELHLECRRVEEHTEDAHGRSEVALRRRCEVAGRLETSSVVLARAEAAAHKAETVALVWEEEALEEAGRLGAACTERRELVRACSEASAEAQDLSANHGLEPDRPRLLCEVWEVIAGPDRCSGASTGSLRLLGEQWLPQDLGRGHDLQLPLVPRVLLSRPAEGKPGIAAAAGLRGSLELQLSVRSLDCEDGSGEAGLTVSGLRLVCQASVSSKPRETVLHVWRWGRGGEPATPSLTGGPTTTQHRAARCETSGDGADTDHSNESESEEDEEDSEDRSSPPSTRACQGREFGLTACAGVGGDLLYAVTATTDAASTEPKVCCAGCCLALCAERSDLKLSPLPGQALCSSWALVFSSQHVAVQLQPQTAAAGGPSTPGPTDSWEADFLEASFTLPMLVSTSDLAAAESLRTATMRQATVELARHWLREELAARATKEETLANKVKALEEKEGEAGFKRDIRQAAEVGALVGAVSTLRRESGELRLRVQAASNRRTRDSMTGDRMHVTIRHAPQVLEPPPGPGEALENHQRLLRLLRGGGTEGYYSLLYRDTRMALSVSVQRPAVVAAATSSGTSKPRRPTAAVGLSGRIDLRLEVRQPLQHQLGECQLDFASVRLECVDVDVAALHLETLPVPSADLPSPVFRQSLHFELLEIHCGPPALSVVASLVPSAALGPSDGAEADTYSCKTLLPLGVACFLRPLAGGTPFGELWQALGSSTSAPAMDLAAPGRDSPALLLAQHPEFCSALCLGGALHLYSNLGGGGVGFAGELPPHGCVGEAHQVLVRAASNPAAEHPSWQLAGRSAEPRLAAAVIAAMATQMKGWSWGPVGAEPEGPLL